MLCLVFKCGSWLEKGDLLSGSKLSTGVREHCALYILFISIIVVIFFSLCCSVKLFISTHKFCLFLLILFPIPSEGGEE